MFDGYLGLVLDVRIPIVLLDIVGY